MSLVLRPQIMPAEASVLTLLCGLATAEAIEAETGLSAGIKWPNDILINGKKAVGILLSLVKYNECASDDTPLHTLRPNVVEAYNC